MGISEGLRQAITDSAINYLRTDGLYVDVAQNRGRYFRNTFYLSASPFGTSGTHSCLDVIVEDVVRALTDFYSTSAADVSLNLIRINSSALTGRCGLAPLVNGLVVIPNTTITLNTLVFVTPQSPFLGTISTTKTPGSSFSIASTSPTDSGFVAWQLIEMG